MGKSSGATFSKIQVDIASKCCQMVKNDRILADERPFQHFLAILAHFMPIYTRIFENGTARLRCPSGVSRALFCRSETISKVGNIKIMSASSPFFFSPLSPPFSFLSRVVCRLMGVQKTQFRCRCGENPLSPLPSLFSPVWFVGSWESKKPSFGVVAVKMGKSSGATFSKIQVDIASKCCQMVKNDRILADERPFQHFLAILAHFMPIYTRIFENGTARLRCPSGVSRALLLSFRNYLQSGQYKNYECQQSFFLLPSLPSLLFSLPCGL